MHGNSICQNIDLEEVKEHYIYKVLISHNVTEVAAIYKTSKENFWITLQSYKSALKCQGYDLCGISDNNM